MSYGVGADECSSTVLEAPWGIQFKLEVLVPGSQMRFPRAPEENLPSIPAEMEIWFNII